MPVPGCLMALDFQDLALSSDATGSSPVRIAGDRSTTSTGRSAGATGTSRGTTASSMYQQLPSTLVRHTNQRKPGTQWLQTFSSSVSRKGGVRVASVFTSAAAARQCSKSKTPMKFWTCLAVGASGVRFKLAKPDSLSADSTTTSSGRQAIFNFPSRMFCSQAVTG